MSDLPVVVVGAGPSGLAAAAHLLERGLQPLVLEAGVGPAPAVEQWRHVRLFSAWPEVIDQAAARLLAGTDWDRPVDGYPNGAEWIERYLAPLAAALGHRVTYGSRVTGISRKGRDRLVGAERHQQPFVVHATALGEERRIEARAVIDASGTWGRPGPAGADGLPALGEKACADAVRYAIPDPADLMQSIGRHTVVVGAGASALTAVNGLADVVRGHPGTQVTWVVRRGSASKAFGGGEADELENRGALGLRAREAVEAGHVQLAAGFRPERFGREGHRVVVVAEDGRALVPADRVIVLTGFRPDLSFLSEMRLDLDPTLEAPRALAAEIDPDTHSCGSVAATGAADLAQPEPDLYLVGMKSYGRAPTFLAMTGYEQVRSVAAQLAGDYEAARRVELRLPGTGVCGGAGFYDVPVTTVSIPPSGVTVSADGCCAPVEPAANSSSVTPTT